jgi:hypothetical protein
MRARIWLLVFLAIPLAACSFQAPPGIAPFLRSIRGAPVSATPTPAWDDRSIYREGLSPAAQSILGGLPGATVYSIDLSIADDMTHLSGREDVHYTNRTGLPLERIEMRLYANLLGGASQVSAVSVDGHSVTPSLAIGNSLLRIPLPSPLQPGTSTRLQVDFTLSVPTDIHTSYGILAYTDGVLSLAHGYPMVAVYDANGWNEEIPSPWGDILYNQACFYLVRVDAPAGLTLVATGREVQRQERGGRQQITFADGPGRDFYLAASADYARTSRLAGEIRVNSYAPRGDEAQSARAAATAAAAIQDYSRRYAPYPYREFDIVAIPTEALGIEYPGLVAIFQDLYTPPAAGDVHRQKLLEFTLAHETGHQWFYNLVGNNQIDEPWLDESLTQFISRQYYLDRYGQAAANTFQTQSLQSNWDGIHDAAIPIGKPVGDYTPSEYEGIIYGRGAFFFLALEDQIGQPAFDAFMRDYVETYAWGVATTAGLKQVAEKGCGCDLTPLFQEWVYVK